MESRHGVLYDISDWLQKLDQTLDTIPASNDVDSEDEESSRRRVVASDGRLSDEQTNSCENSHSAGHSQISVSTPRRKTTASSIHTGSQSSRGGSRNPGEMTLPASSVKMERGDFDDDIDMLIPNEVYAMAPKPPPQVPVLSLSLPKLDIDNTTMTSADSDEFQLSKRDWKDDGGHLDVAVPISISMVDDGLSSALLASNQLNDKYANSIPTTASHPKDGHGYNIYDTISGNLDNVDVCDQDTAESTTTDEEDSHCLHRDVHASSTYSSLYWDDVETLTSAAPTDSNDTKEYIYRENNCHGIVHLRIIRAKQLPLGPGSSVHAQIVLSPWKDKIRTEKVMSYERRSAGCCTKWNRESTHSLVHAYNNEETPLPAIKIDILSTSQTLLFETNVCSFNISCASLMCSPSIWKKKWISADSYVDHHGNLDSNASGEGIDKEPLVLIEACFQPSHKMYQTQGSSSVNRICKEVNRRGSIGDDDALIIPSSPVPEKEKNYRAESGRIERKMTDEGFLERPSGGASSSPHLFRVYPFWAPAYCSICSCLITGWRVKAYRCEICDIDCCSECQLRANLQLPCGSSEAQKAVSEAFQTKFSVNKILSVVAPEQRFVGQNKHGDKNFENQDVQVTIADSSQIAPLFSGIGTINLRLIRASIFDKPISPESDINNADEVNIRGGSKGRAGDYYVRVSWTGSGKKSLRTETIYQTSKPLFDGKGMIFDVANYGMEFRIELIDANTDKPIGSTLITTQGLLQDQRDAFLESEDLSVWSLLSAKKKQRGKVKSKLALRCGVKRAFGLDFYDATTTDLDGNSGDDKGNIQAGEITGWIEVDVDLKEQLNLFYSMYPSISPTLPSDEFKMDLVQLHFARMKALIADFGRVVEGYNYITSWENATITGLSFILFVASCLIFDTEYVGSLPLLWTLLYMIMCGQKRKSGAFKANWVQTEREARRDAAQRIAKSHTIHRPLAHLNVTVYQGRNLKSSELGMPAMFKTTVTWSPYHYMTDSKKFKVGEYDVTAMHKHRIGATNTSGVTKNPVWDDRRKSEEALRLKMLLSGANLLPYENSKNSETWLSDIWNENSFVYPILQPIKKLKSKRDGSNALSLSSWKSSPGAIVIQVHNVLNALFDDCVGEVVIPLSGLVNDEGQLLDGRNVRGWTYLHDAGAEYDELEIIDDALTDESEMEDIIDLNDENFSHSGIASDFVDEEIADNLLAGDNICQENTEATGVANRSHDSATEGNLDHEDDQSRDMSSDGRAAIYISCSLILPHSTDQITDVEKEASIVVAQEMIQTASMSKENIGMIGSSINTINTVRGMGGNAQWLQNTLGDLLDLVESFRNLFTWACPQKSMLVFSVLCVVWLVLCIIPTRYIILSAGLHEFIGKHIIAAFFDDTSKDEYESDDDEENNDNGLEVQQSIPILTHFNNLVAAVPNDEDLRRAYFWEARRLGGVERDDLAKAKRISRLKSLWRARWYGELHLKISTNVGAGWKWRNIFAIIQGHRLMWWVSSNDFDRGKKPLGQIIFAGHAGLAGLSPLDLRQMQKSEFSRAISVFGRGEIEQQKLILLASSDDEKELIERLIAEITLDPKID